MRKVSFRWNIQEVARNKGVSSALQLAERAGLAQGTATSLWHGRPLRLDLATLARVCQALECLPNDVLIMEGEEPKDRAPGQIALVTA